MDNYSYITHIRILFQFRLSLNYANFFRKKWPIAAVLTRAPRPESMK